MNSDKGIVSGVDGISCVGLLLIILLGGSLLMGALRSNGRLQPVEMAAAITATAATPYTAVLHTITPSPLAPLVTETAVPPSHTPLPTATPSPTDTATATATATATVPPEPTATATPILLPTPLSAVGETVRVPILMYHYISVPPENADIYRIDLSVTPDNFRAQMEYLAENGFTAVDLYDLSLAMAQQKPLPPKPVIITIDDGYRDAYTEAFPILEAFGMKATFFIITQFVEQGHPAYMSWAMIEEIAAAGHRMEPHSRTHPELHGRDREFLIDQILGSQEALAARLGYTPRYFCYPAGRYDETTLAVLEELDFWGALTTRSGRTHSLENRYEWTRLRVRHVTTLRDFAGLVN